MSVFGDWHLLTMEEWELFFLHQNKKEERLQEYPRAKNWHALRITNCEEAQKKCPPSYTRSSDIRKTSFIPIINTLLPTKNHSTKARQQPSQKCTSERNRENSKIYVHWTACITAKGDVSSSVHNRDIVQQKQCCPLFVASMGGVFTKYNVQHYSVNFPPFQLSRCRVIFDEKTSELWMPHVCKISSISTTLDL